MSEVRRILVVEDAAPIRELVEMVLQLEGWEVRGASTGTEGLEIVAAEHVDLVILDWMLPDLDGIAVMERIHGLCAMPVILLTARDDLESKVHALGSGANGFLLKPFRIEHLISAVAHLLADTEPSGCGRAGADVAEPKE